MMGLPYGEEIMIVGRTMWTQCPLEDILTFYSVRDHGAFVTFMIFCAAYKCTYLLYLQTDGRTDGWTDRIKPTFT